jgi:hypothetical protein
MHVLKLALLFALCTGASFLTAQTPQSGSTAIGSASRIVFSSGTNAYNLTVATTDAGPAQVGVGQPAPFLVTVTPIDRYNQPVKLDCSNLPPETSCSFDLQTLPAGGGTTRMYLNTSAPRDCGSSTPYFYGSLRYLGPMLAGMLLLCWPGRRLPMRGLIGLFVLGTMLGLEGCGRCTDLGTRPGTYTFLLNGTGQDTVALALGDLVTVPITITVSD